MTFPDQQNVAVQGAGALPPSRGAYDMRSHLVPRRLTMVMWDEAFLLRHQPGEGFADWDRVLDEAVERGYNTLRLDPMPQSIDLSQPDRPLTWQDVGMPFLPWDWQHRIELPAGRALLEFLHKAVRRGLWFTLSAWWRCNETVPGTTVRPRTTMEGAELWANMLRALGREVGFERLVYVDFANEMPFFFPDFLQQLKRVDSEAGFEESTVVRGFSDRQKAWLRDALDKPLAALQAEFPGLRFTHSIHGDVRWIDAGLTAWDCLDAHFYTSADPRWSVRTHFPELARNDSMFRDSSGFRAFSDRCRETYKSVGPMLHARQRQAMRRFSAWSESCGMPLTCSEGWSSWFYIDHPDLDWGWLLEYSEQAIDDAIEFGFWGVTPNNYVQPQFELWKNARFHQRINQRFLAS
jgi:hypothetical protein